MNKGIGGRIVGGTDARRGEFPWQISYQFTFGNAGFHSCGGSILNENKIGKIFLLEFTAYHRFCLNVVTAAHCCDAIGIEDTRIVAGDHNVDDDSEGQEQFMNIESLKMHEKYDAVTIDFDVCIITVSLFG